MARRGRELLELPAESTGLRYSCPSGPEGRSSI